MSSWFIDNFIVSRSCFPLYLEGEAICTCWHHSCVQLNGLLSNLFCFKECFRVLQDTLPKQTKQYRVVRINVSEVLFLRDQHIFDAWSYIARRSVWGTLVYFVQVKSLCKASECLFNLGLSSDKCNDLWRFIFARSFKQ